MQSPDETGHLTRAYMISRGELALEHAPEGSPPHWGGSGGQIDKHLGAFLDGIADVRSHSDSRAVQHARLPQQAAIHWAHSERFYPAPGTNYYLPLIYAPHASALWVARQLDLSMTHSYLLLEGTVIAACLALLLLAWRVQPPGELAFGLIFVPMSLYQLLSPTIDGLALSLAVLLLSLFWRALRRPGGAGRKLLWGIHLCAIVLVTSRIYLAPILALPAYLAWRERSARQAAACLLAAVLCAAWMAFGMATTIDERVVRSMGSLETARTYLQAPHEFVALVVRTFGDAERARHYLHAFVGILGWMDLPISGNSVRHLLVALAVLATAACVSCALALRGPPAVRDPVPPAARMLLVGVGLACVLAALAALAVTWNPYPAAYIDGLQGRYFLVPALIAAFALTPSRPLAGALPSATAWRRIRAGLCIAYVCGALYVLARTLARKYDYLPLF